MFNFESSEKQFTAADMVSFGKYLLSEDRTDSIVYNTKENQNVIERLANVYDADLRNWENDQFTEIQEVAVIKNSMTDEEMRLSGNEWSEHKGKYLKLNELLTQKSEKTQDLTICNRMYIKRKDTYAEVTLQQPSFLKDLLSFIIKESDNNEVTVFCISEITSVEMAYGNTKPTALHHKLFPFPHMGFLYEFEGNKISIYPGLSLNLEDNHEDNIIPSIVKSEDNIKVYMGIVENVLGNLRFIQFEIEKENVTICESFPEFIIHINEEQASTGLDICGYSGKWEKSKKAFSTEDTDYWNKVRNHFLELGGEYLNRK